MNCEMKKSIRRITRWFKRVWGRKCWTLVFLYIRGTNVSEFSSYTYFSFLIGYFVWVRVWTKRGISRLDGINYYVIINKDKMRERENLFSSKNFSLQTEFARICILYMWSFCLSLSLSLLWYVYIIMWNIWKKYPQEWIMFTNRYNLFYAKGRA